MNKNVFKPNVKQSNMVKNDAGGNAYKFENEHAITQMAMTSFFQDGFYKSASNQFSMFKELLLKVDPYFLGQLAVYSHEYGKMKDVPVVILAFLMKPETMSIFDLVFPRVITNGKQLCNFMSVVRSKSVTKNKSFGSHTRNIIRKWINQRSLRDLHKDSIGNELSLSDAIKMVHVKTSDEIRNSFYSYIIGKTKSFESLPDFIKDFENFKSGKSTKIPDVDHRFLTSLPLTTEQWKQVGRNMPWHALRINLNTLNRHGCFEDQNYVKEIADKLRSMFNQNIKMFPYQLLATYQATAENVPVKISNVIQDLLDMSLKNIESLDSDPVLMVDVSGSMSGGTLSDKSKVRPIDVAGLMAAAILKKNEDGTIYLFHDEAFNCKLNARDSVVTNARKISEINGCSTNCSAPLILANEKQLKNKIVIFVSDNESWMDYSNKRKTQVKNQWDIYKNRVPDAKLICIDTIANNTTQILDCKSVLNIGGFSDEIFKVINDFVRGKETNFVEEIRKISLDKSEN